MQYTIWIVTPPNYKHSRCFEEVAMSLNAALVALGHECRTVTSSFECRGRTIVLGGHLLGDMPFQDLPRDMVIYNLEQISKGSPWLTTDYLRLLKGKHPGILLKHNARRFELWDYCRGNVEALAQMGIEAKLVPIGYMPCLTRIENAAVLDIDVLHIGSVNDRRERVLRDLAARGVIVRQLFGEYGVARDASIARAKIVLNMHFYPAKIFEIVRCSYLMANRKSIVSEIGNDAESESRFYDGIAFVGYESLADQCERLLQNDVQREELAKKGFNIFSGMSQIDYLKGVV